MYKKIAEKTLILLLCVAVIATGVWCGFSADTTAYAATDLPDVYDSLWYDGAAFLDTAATVTKVNAMMAEMTAEEKAALRAKPIVIAVIDTGIYADHELFDGLLYKNTAELNGTAGVDDDGNGFIDDACGWDFVSNDNTPADETTKPDSHGTHVAGIIAAEIIRYGLSDYIKILPIRAGNAKGSFSSGLADDASWVVNAIDYAIKMDVDVINMSFRCEMYAADWNAKSNLNAKIQEANNRQIVLVAAVGNDAYEATTVRNTMSPAALDNVIGVMGYDKNGKIAKLEAGKGSNYGTVYDVVAPYVDVYSAVRNGYVKKDDGTDGYVTVASGDGYAKKDGTSMATPFVSFMAAVMMIKYERHADVVNYTFENCATKLIDDTYKTVSLSAYLGYKPITSLSLEKAVGELTQSVLSRTEISFSVDANYYGGDSYAPDNDDALSEIKVYVRRCNKNGTPVDDEILYQNSGTTFAFTPDKAGYYKVYAKLDRYENIESNFILVNVEYAEVKDVTLSVSGETTVRADGTYAYSVENYDLINPSNNVVQWFVYKDNQYIKSISGSTFSFEPSETGTYNIVCKIEADGVSKTLAELSVTVKMSKQNADKIIGGVSGGLTIAACVAVLIAALVKTFKRKKA